MRIANPLFHVYRSLLYSGQHFYNNLNITNDVAKRDGAGKIPRERARENTETERRRSTLICISHARSVSGLNKTRFHLQNTKRGEQEV